MNQTVPRHPYPWPYKAGKGGGDAAEAVAQAFQDLYQDTHGGRRAWADAWRRFAAAFVGERGVVAHAQAGWRRQARSATLALFVLGSARLYRPHLTASGSAAHASGKGPARTEESQVPAGQSPSSGEWSAQGALRRHVTPDAQPAANHLPAPETPLAAAPERAPAARSLPLSLYDLLLTGRGGSCERVRILCSRVAHRRVSYVLTYLLTYLLTY